MKSEILLNHQLKLICLIVSGLLIILSFSNLSSRVTNGVNYSKNPETLPYTTQIKSINKTMEIENTILKIDEGLISKYIQKLQDFKTRNSYRPDKCFTVSEYIYSIFQNNELNTSYDPFSYAGWNMRNVIGEKPGASTSSNIYIVCAHYDSVSGFALVNAPGADDNGSGVAAVLAAAEVLSDYEFNYTIRFIAFSGEEQGMRGSSHYATNCKAIGENISGVINLDMIAYNPDPSTNHAKAYTNSASETLANNTIAIAQKYATISNIILDNAGSASNSDHASFWPEYQAIMLHEKTFNTPNYHKPTDTIDKLNLTYCANISQVAIATLAELAELNSTDTHTPSHNQGYPPPNGYSNSTPTLSLEITDPSLINQSSITMFIGGNAIGHTLNSISLGYNVSYFQTIPYTDGQTILVNVIANDTLGNGFNYSWQFYVDAIPPQSPTNFSIELSRIETVKKGLAIDHGASAEPDAYYAHCPTVIYHDNEYKMWYTGYYSKYQIMYANSTDGVNWIKRGVVISNGSFGSIDDVHVAYQSVLWDSEYKMWYSGYDGAHWRIIYANSSDGIGWSKQGVVIDNEPSGNHDVTHAYAPCVIKTDEYKMWYNGEDGYDWWVLYANSSDGINWTKVSNPIMNREYENPNEEAYGLYPNVLWNVTGYYMWYMGYDGAYYRVLHARSNDGISWNKCGVSIDRSTTVAHDYGGAAQTSNIIINSELKTWYSAYNSSDGYWRIMYSSISTTENKTDILLSWSPSTDCDNIFYEISRDEEHALNNAWNKYTYWKYTTYLENKLGDENNSNYYYKVRAIDKVGNIGECQTIVGKIGTPLVTGWNIVSNIFLNGSENLANALLTAKWVAARSYNQYNLTEPWESNIVGRPTSLNNLNSMNQTSGLWLCTQSEEIYATAGEVTNICIYLKAGWNLVAYPYHTIKNITEALMGVPWDCVERFNSTAEYDLTEMAPSESMNPGKGYWIHVTSDTTWVATNL
jgi:hypothetical protein